jgi:RES domain-containing protein
LKSGGRYNSPGEFRALYTSLDQATASAEVERGLWLRGVDPKHYKGGDWWHYELQVELEAVLDLTDAAILRRLQLQRESLVREEWTVTRRVAAEARNGGYQALLVPSAARPGSKNLVIFPDRLPAVPVVLSSRPVSFEGGS